MPTSNIPASISLAVSCLLLPSLRSEEPASVTVDPPAADRAAILAMAGEFSVTFRFEETIPLQPGYVLTKPYHEEARELVVVAEETPGRIALQHLLLVGDNRTIQHWRQVWTYQDIRITEFQGRNTWKSRVLTPAEVRGTWTQMVTNVDNSPRYEGLGRWEHANGVSSWTAGETWRPLPRREYSKRDDYDVVVGPYCHTIVPTGWTHEQTNSKLDLAEPASRLLAREFGLNNYRRVSDADFAPAKMWWTQNREFSNALSAAWSEVTQSKQSYAIADDIDTANLRRELSRLSKVSVTPEERESRIREVINRFVRSVDQSKVVETR